MKIVLVEDNPVDVCLVREATAESAIDEEASAEALLRHADEAMYGAKRGGKATVRHHLV